MAPLTTVALSAQTRGTFRLWATADSHVDVDLELGRRSLADAITDSEQGGDEGGPAFDWDIMLHLGDMVGAGGYPEDAQGEEILRQLSTLSRHRREDVYFLLGNHDASPEQRWFRTWIDPLGENRPSSGVDHQRRTYPPTGTWERYSFQVGNILFLMMGDRNDGPPPSGRAFGPDPSKYGIPRPGYPAGKVTDETFRWWVEMVEANPDKIIVSAHHHMLEGTTNASGLDEGVPGVYHGFVPDGAPEGSSFVYFVGEEPHARRFEDYLEKHPGAIDLWLGGHTHSDPDDVYGGKSQIERRWGVGFVNVAQLTRFHVIKRSPKSRLLSFTEGSDRVRIQCYLHTSDYADEGWYDSVETELPLRHPFSWQSDRTRGSPR